MPELPRRMRRLPIDERGYPVPWFVGWVGGKPDFRLMGEGKIMAAVHQHACWLCGQPLGQYLAFVVGPMCAVNRISSEPPSHRDCAEFAAVACPFLSMPKAQRREVNLPSGIHNAGVMIARNPGVALVWITRLYAPRKAPGGVLFHMGDPLALLWFAEGRRATREEVLASIESGMPILRQSAAEQGADSVMALNKEYRAALELVPA
jgi:hypothetical protein